MIDPPDPFDLFGGIALRHEGELDCDLFAATLVRHTFGRPGWGNTASAYRAVWLMLGPRPMPEAHVWGPCWAAVAEGLAREPFRLHDSLCDQDWLLCVGWRANRHRTFLLRRSGPDAGVLTPVLIVESSRRDGPRVTPRYLGALVHDCGVVMAAPLRPQPSPDDLLDSSLVALARAKLAGS